MFRRTTPLALGLSGTRVTWREPTAPHACGSRTADGPVEAGPSHSSDPPSDQNQMSGRSTSNVRVTTCPSGPVAVST
jgi:hypothetical protein